MLSFTIPEIPATWIPLLVGGGGFIGAFAIKVWDSNVKQAEKKYTDALTVLSAQTAELEKQVAECNASHRKRDEQEEEASKRHTEVIRLLAIAETKIEFLMRVEESRNIATFDKDKAVAAGITSQLIKHPEILQAAIEKKEGS